MRTRPISVTDLARSPASAIQGAVADGHPRLVTRRGRPVAVLLDLATFRRLGNDLELLRRLALGEVESAAGRGHAMAEVLADCDLLLEEN
jgi:prevent-host-death family protein